MADQSMAGLSHRKPTSAVTFRDSCGTWISNKRYTMYSDLLIFYILHDSKQYK